VVFEPVQMVFVPLIVPAMGATSNETVNTFDTTDGHTPRLTRAR